MKSLLSKEGADMKKEHFSVTGMTCSACSARIERGIAKLPAVSVVSVNLLKNSMTVSYDEAALSSDEIVAAVAHIGYGASSMEKKKTAPKSEAPEKNEQDSAKRRLIVSAVFTIPLFYISMGGMLGAPLPDFLVGMENALISAFTQFLLTLPVIIAGNRYFRVGFKNLVKRSANMDSLIALGSGAAFVYGIYAIYKIGWGLGHGDMAMVHAFSMDLYFESSAMILTLITLGKYFETRAKSRTSKAITALMDLAPKTAIVLRDGVETEISTDDIVIGDIIIVKTGENLAVDGEIVSGAASIDVSAITGESLPVSKTEGDAVTGATLCKNGYFKMRATAVGEDTALAKIIALVDEATSSKAPIAKLADKVSGVFVPVVIAIAVVAALVWLLTGHSFETSLTILISVLVISCPCALGLATPTAIMVGTGAGASHGILIKSAEALESLHAIDTVVLDKTGTITNGKPIVTDVISLSDDLISAAFSIEALSAHPLSEAIVAYAASVASEKIDVTDFENLAGLGLSGKTGQGEILAGNERLMRERSIDISAVLHKAEALSQDGKTPLYFSLCGKLLGLIAVADTVKETSAEAVKELASMGIEVVMLTGDNAATASAIGKSVGITNVISDVFPDDKQAEVKRLQSLGKKVCMVGDGINDAPALAQADIGTAIGAGTDVAIESADIVLMRSDLLDVPASISLSKAVMRKIKQNLFWAFIYNAIGIPIAAGALSPFGILLNPMIAAAAMSFSSVSVVTNALTLKNYKYKKEKPKMIKTVLVNGMSCNHCVMAVKKALSNLPWVTEVEVSLDEKKAVITSTNEIADAQIKAAIEGEGFEFAGIE